MRVWENKIKNLLYCCHSWFSQSLEGHLSKTEVHNENYDARQFFFLRSVSIWRWRENFEECQWLHTTKERWRGYQTNVTHKTADGEIVVVLCSVYIADVCDHGSRQFLILCSTNQYFSITLSTKYCSKYFINKVGCWFVLLYLLSTYYVIGKFAKLSFLHFL